MTRKEQLVRVEHSLGLGVERGDASHDQRVIVQDVQPVSKIRFAGLCISLACTFACALMYVNLLFRFLVVGRDHWFVDSVFFRGHRAVTA